MSALLNGFRTGYQAMNQYYQQEENKRRYEQQYQRQLSSDNMSQERHGVYMDQAGLRTQDMQNNVDRMPLDNAYIDETRALNVAGQGQQNAIRQNSVERIPQDNQYIDDTRALNVSAGQQQSQITEMQLKQAKKAQITQELGEILQIGDAQRLTKFMQSPEIKGTNLATIQSIEGAQAATTLHKALESGDVAKAGQAANTVFKSQLQKPVGTVGRNGSQITGVEIKSVEEDNGNGMFKVPVLVTTANGQKYRSFLSELRSSDPNDPVKLFDPQVMFGTVEGLNQTSTILQNGGYFDDLKKNYATRTQNMQTEQGEDPSAVRTVKHIAKVKNISEGEAWNFYKNRDGERQKHILKVMSQVDEYATPEERQEIMKTAGAEFDNVYGVQQQTQTQNQDPLNSNDDDPLGILGGN